MQFQSDLLNAKVVRPIVTETTALGAAYLAGLHAGVYHSTSELAAMWHCERRFEPGICTEQRNHLYAKWQHAVAQVRL